MNSVRIIWENSYGYKCINLINKINKIRCIIKKKINV